MLIITVTDWVQDEDCVYTVYVRTGSIIKGGTDSVIGLKLYDKSGYGIYITNLWAVRNNCPNNLGPAQLTDVAIPRAGPAFSILESTVRV